MIKGKKSPEGASSIFSQNQGAAEKEYPRSIFLG
jgi:hypothetical protein